LTWLPLPFAEWTTQQQCIARARLKGKGPPAIGKAGGKSHVRRPLHERVKE
jgi:hypothetical protein